MAGFFSLFSQKTTDNRIKQPTICSLILPAAGTSSRMNGENKLFMELSGVPVIVRTLMVIEDCDRINEVIIAAQSENIIAIGDLCRKYEIKKVRKIISGGETRLLSVRAALCEVSSDSGLIAIHDAARPLVTVSVILEAIEAAEKFGAAAPSVQLKDTIKESKNDMVVRTLDRVRLSAVQTPQVFEASLIKCAVSKAVEDGVDLTDDCAAVERIGMSVRLTCGSYENIKITTPEDIHLAEALFSKRDY